MAFFRPDNQDEKLTELLRQSKQDFRFDKDAVKFSLLNQIAAAPRTERSLGRKLVPHYATAFVILLVFALSGSTLAYANNSKPGDRLFFLDVAAEKSLMALPLPSTSKAKIQAGIVAERVDELVKIENDAKPRNKAQIKAVVESQSSLSQAVESIVKQQEKLETEGKDKNADELDEVLIRLEVLAEKQEENAEKIRSKVSEIREKEELESRLMEIKKARKKAQDAKKERRERREKKGGDNNSGSGSGGKVEGRIRTEIEVRDEKNSRGGAQPDSITADQQDERNTNRLDLRKLFERESH